MKKAAFSLSLSKDARAFLDSQDAKQFRQIARKVFSLLENPRPHDSAILIGFSPLLRVDVGEYRIIYQEANGKVEVWLIDKRNDDVVYKKLKRLF